MISKKTKKVKRSTLSNKADKLFSLKIREVGICMLAGIDKVKCGGSLQCMHIVGRANRRLRWDDMNALCGCAGHHTYYTNHPWEWVGIIQNKFPSKYAYIEKHRNEIWDKDILKILSELESIS